MGRWGLRFWLSLSEENSVREGVRGLVAAPLLVEDLCRGDYVDYELAMGD